MVVGAGSLVSMEATPQPPSPAEARAIAKEAYTYGFLIVDSYRILYSYFVDRSSPEYKAGWNERVANNARVFTPDDTAMQTPNSDTPYSQLGLDLRAEPMVLTMPAVEKGRYYTAEVNDLYTFISGYIGSRTTGNEAGHFLIAGPAWKGEAPKGIKAVIRSETELSFVFYRTQLFRPDDIVNVKKIQAGFKVQRLSAFLGQPAPARPLQIAFLKPISADEERTSLDFFKVLNFVLQFCPTHPSEAALMARFARLDIGAGKTFAPDALAPEIRKAIEDGRADAWQAHEEIARSVNAGEITSGDVLGSRDTLKNNYLYRMHGTVAGIWGNAKEERSIRATTSTPRARGSMARAIATRSALPSIASRQCLLVAHHVPDAVAAARCQSAQSLSDQFPHVAGPEARRRRRAHALPAA
jgi:hypothetical protein